jgi:hypothetical protein
MIIAACVGVGAIGAVAAYHYDAASYTSEGIPPPLADILAGDNADHGRQTPAYLIAHPAALRAAAIECQNSAGPDVVDVCDNVHSAESGLLAIQYRNAAAGKTQ